MELVIKQKIYLGDIMKVYEKIKRGLEEALEYEKARFGNIYYSDDLMIDISEDKKLLRVSYFNDGHYKTEKIIKI